MRSDDDDDDGVDDGDDVCCNIETRQARVPLHFWQRWLTLDRPVR